MFPLTKPFLRQTLAASFCLLAFTAGATEVRYAGTWYDQDKYHLISDPLSGGWNYYQYDSDWLASLQVLFPGAQPYYRRGDVVSEILPADTNGNHLEDGDEDWGNWSGHADLSCWAAAASNLVRAVGGGDRYHDWMYVTGIDVQSTWYLELADIFTGYGPGMHTWTEGGLTQWALDDHSGYPTATGHGTLTSAAKEWENPPDQRCETLLKQGKPVSLSLTWDFNVIPDGAHAITLYAIDTVHHTMTFADSDTDPDEKNTVTRNYLFDNVRFEDEWVVDFYGNGNYYPIRYYATFASQMWYGSGNYGDSTSLNDPITHWDDVSNWTWGDIPGYVPNSQSFPVVEFRHAGALHINSDARAQKLTILGALTRVLVNPEGALFCGALQVSGGATLDATDSTVHVQGDFISDGHVFFNNVTHSSGSARIGVNRMGQVTQSGGFAGGPELLMGVWPEGDGYYQLRDGGNAMFQSVQVGIAGGGEFDHVSGTMTATEVKLGLQAGSTGSYNVFAGELAANLVVVGDSGEGHFTQHGGQVRVADILYVGAQATGVGSYDQESGTMTATEVKLGLQAGSTGSYDVRAGGFDANLVVVGDSGEGHFTQHGGQVRVVDTLYVGEKASGVGSYDHESGSMVAGEVKLGLQAGSTGNYNVLASDFAANLVVVGDSGEGHFTQHGGQVRVADILYVGAQATGVGNYDMTGGSLTADRLRVGHRGQGALLQSGGAAVISQSMHLGFDTGGFGSYGFGSFILSGNGSLSAWNLSVGEVGEGTLVQSDTSSLIVDSLTVGYATGSEGSVQLQSGTLTARTLQIGVHGDGEVIQTGGVLTVRGEMRLGCGAGGTGGVTISGGTLHAGSLVVDRVGAVRFDQLDGNVCIEGDLELNGHGGSYYGISRGLLDVRNGTINIGGENSLLRMANGTVIADTVLPYDNDSIDIGSGVGLAELRVNSYSHAENDTVHLECNLQLGHTGGSGSASYAIGAGALRSDVNLVIGYDATAVVRLQDDLSVIHGNLQIVLGDQVGGFGRLEMPLGKIETYRLTVGNRGTGQIASGQGAQNVSCEEVILGEQAGSHGIYELRNVLYAHTLDVGLGGWGEFQQSGGSLSAGQIHIGRDAGAYGDLSISEGTIDAAGTIEVGGLGQGVLRILGGQVNAEELAFGTSGSFHSEGSGGILRVGAITNRPAAFSMTGSLELGVGRRAPFDVSDGQTVYAELLKVTAGDVMVEGTGLLTAGTFSAESDITSTLTLQNGGTLVADRFQLQSLGIFTSTANSTLRVNSIWLGDDADFTTAGRLQFGHAGGGGRSDVTLAAGRSLIAGNTLAIGYDAGAEFIQQGGVVNSPTTEVGRMAGSTGIYNHLGGEHNTGTLRVGIQVGSHGTYNLGGSSEALLTTVDTVVGDGGIGVFDQQEGTHRPGHFLYLGRDPDSSGTYTMEGGTLDVWGGSIAVGGSGRGVMTQSDGNVYAHQLIIGQSGGSGLYTYTGGVLSADTTIVGETSEGNFTLEGEMSWHQSMMQLQIGHGASSTGVYSLTDGRLSTNTMVVGNSGDGSLLQTGGSIEVMSSLSLGAQAGSHGSYLLDASGQISAMMLNVGGSGLGNFDHRSGSVDVGMDMMVGGSADGNGVYEIREGSLRVGGTLSIGENGPGRLSMTGGFLGDITSRTVYANTLRFGASGIFDATGVGNTLVVNQMENMPTNFSFAGALGVGNMAGWGSHEVALSGSQELSASVVMVGYEAEGTISLSGTSRLSTNALDVGFGDWSSGHVVQSTGTSVTILDSINIGCESASGDYAMSGGSLEAPDASLRVGNGGTGSFTISGGTVTIGQVDVGGAGSGSFALNGGLVMAEDFSVQATGRFAGEGTEAALRTNGLSFAGPSLSMNGTLAIGHSGGSGSGSFTLAAGKTLSSSILAVGYDAPGELIQNGGINQVETTLRIASESGSGGAYSLGDGSLLTATTVVGRNGAGSFTQTGGTHQISGDLYVSYASGASGRYLLGGGSLSSAYEYIAWDGNGTFSQSGGNHTTTSLYMAMTAASRATYDFSGGDLIASGIYAGYAGKAQFVQTNGNFRPQNALYLGYNAGAEADYLFSGGTLSSTIEYVGRAGIGRVFQSGGSNTVNTLYLGYTAGGNGRYDLGGSGMIDVARDLFVGYNSSGLFTQSGGTAEAGTVTVGYNAGATGNYAFQGGSLSAGDLVVSYRGPGTFVQSGGDLTATRIKLGTHAAGNGRYELSGGTLSATSYERIGEAGQGTFIHSSGTNRTPSLQIGTSAGAIGVYTISGGVLDVSAGTIALGVAGSGVFNHDGGEVVANILSRGAMGTWNSGAQAGVLQVNGLSGFASLTANGGMWLGHTGGSGSGSLSLAAGQSLTVHQSLMVGYTAPASFSQTGGTATLDNLYVGGLDGGNGAYLISGGTLDARNGKIELGLLGTGSLSLNGGLVVADELRKDTPGTFASSGNSSTLRVNQLTGFGGQFAVAGKLEIGHSGGTGAAGYSVMAGDSLAANDITFGYDGSCLVMQTGSNSTVNAAESIRLGENVGGTATYTLRNGTLQAQHLLLGSAGGTGTLNLDGGRMSTGELTLYGRINVNSAGTEMTVGENLTFKQGAVFEAVAGSTIHMTGSAFVNESIDPADLADMENLGMVFEGGAADLDPFEVAGRDFGAIASGFDLNFALGTLELGGADIGRVQLVSNFDNQPSWIGTEALYVWDLVVNPGSTLDLNGFDLYYGTFTGDPGSISFNGGSFSQVVPEPATYALLLAAGAAALAIRRRQKKFCRVDIHVFAEQPQVPAGRCLDRGRRLHFGTRPCRGLRDPLR